MIKRSGFVSNSSSSSFIVAFPKKDLTQEELYNLLSPNHDTNLEMDEQNTLIDSWYQNEDNPRTDEDVVYRVYGNLGNKILDMDNIKEDIGRDACGWDAWEKFREIKDHQERTRAQNEYMANHPEAKKRFDNLLNEAIKQYGEDNFEFHSFCYADDEGEGWLEHSGIFDNLPQYRISNH